MLPDKTYQTTIFNRIKRNTAVAMALEFFVNVPSGLKLRRDVIDVLLLHPGECACCERYDGDTRKHPRAQL
jgi:hypothetical protein